VARIASNTAQRVLTTILDSEEKPVAADGDVEFTSVYSLTGDDGPAGTAVVVSTGVYAAPMVALMDPELVVTFTATVDSVDVTWQETVEVVGKRMFTLHELRSSDNTLAGKAFQTLSDARDIVEAIFEGETGQSFSFRDTSGHSGRPATGARTCGSSRT
jgi:hypothetical protein